MRTMLIGLVCFAFGLATMWVILRVDFSSTEGARSPDELARAAFKALQAGDFRLFAPHLPNEAGLTAMRESIRTHGDERARERAERRLKRDGGIEGMIAKHLDANRRRVPRGVGTGPRRFGGLDTRRVRRNRRRRIASI